MRHIRIRLQRILHLKSASDGCRSILAGCVTSLNRIKLPSSSPLDGIWTARSRQPSSSNSVVGDRMLRLGLYRIWLYYKSGRSRKCPDLLTQIWPDLNFGRTWITEQYAWWRLSVSAAIKRQYSSVLCYITVCQFLTKFVERQWILYFFHPVNTNHNSEDTTWQVSCL